MSFRGRLVDSANVFHGEITVDSETKQRVSGYPDEASIAAVDCLLIAGFPETAQRIFGRELDADAVIYFPGGTDIRPKPESGSGQGDRIDVTQQNGATSSWFVLAANDPGTFNRGVRVAVKSTAR